MVSRLFAVTAFLVSAAAFAAEPAAKEKGPTDPEIAHIAVTANQVDIDAGKDAIAKSKNPKVKEFAQRMIDDHTSVIKQATDLVTKLKVTPKDNATSQSLKSGGDKARAEIGKKSGAEFDKAYVDNEVSYHEAVINAVDKVLLPNAQNKDLKALLAAVRPALVAHLEHAKGLQKELAGGPAAAHDAGHGSHGSHK
jgi:putative membrane protein